MKEGFTVGQSMIDRMTSFEALLGKANGVR
jgi:hypothetical protein